MAYIINVSRKRIGTSPPKHVFRTAADSIHSKEQAVEVCRALRVAYPKEFFEINASYDMTHSEYIDWENDHV